ncbi:hypothetical protein WEI85_00600 [Actinomycetes bacterium KLBMP 9797]
MAVLQRRRALHGPAGPNTDYRAWGTEYVLVWASGDAGARARLVLHGTPNTDGDTPVVVHVVVDLRERTATVDPGCPAHLRGQADAKAQRVLDLLLACRRERRRGANRPVTAHDRWTASKDKEES